MNVFCGKINIIFRNLKFVCGLMNRFNLKLVIYICSFLVDEFFLFIWDKGDIIVMISYVFFCFIVFWYKVYGEIIIFIYLERGIFWFYYYIDSYIL